MTDQEALKVLQISEEYLPSDKLKELYLRLSQEFDPNDSFKKSLDNVLKLLEPPAPKPWWLRPLLYVLIPLHFILVCGVGSSFVLLPFFAPWYIALPLMTFIWFFSTTRVECKLTILENYLRKELGMKQIGGFVGHYFKKPIRKVWRKIAKF